MLIANYYKKVTGFLEGKEKVEAATWNGLIVLGANDKMTHQASYKPKDPRENSGPGTDRISEISLSIDSLV